ncbi:MAG: SEL1-like repeat protein [Caulobacteraceae bacterium]|nr:SEL1-like repeat protein [Caulobacteraceae bacterium]
MTAGGPWSVKGIDPKAREVAKDLARRSGMTLGEWLNQVILDDPASDFDDPPPRSVSYASPIEEPRHEPRFANHRFYEDEPPRPGPGDLARITTALERLSARIEAAESRSTLAISGIDQSVVGLLHRIEAAEREQTAVAARFETAVDEAREDHGRIGERLRKIEQEAHGPRAIEAMRALEGTLGQVSNRLFDGEARTRDAIENLARRLESLESVEVAEASQQGGGEAAGDALINAVVARIGERLEQAEARTTQAIKGLETSFASLDQRLLDTEDRVRDDAAPRLEQLAAALSERVEAVRSEMAEKLKESSDAGFDRMERALAEMTAHVQAAETRSAQAIERMGHEVLRMADTLGRRVQGVETRSAEAAEQMGGEMARIADAVEGRLNRSDSVQAQALEKLGSEINRITERLAERISNSERRSAQALDDVGEQVSRVAERISQRQERASLDLAERIRQSEERTARILEEAREKIDRRLGEAQRRMAEPFAEAPFHEAAPFAGEVYAYSPQAAAPSFLSPNGPPPAVFAAAAPFVEAPPAASPPSFSAADIAAADGFEAEPAVEPPSDVLSEPLADETVDLIAPAIEPAAEPIPEPALEALAAIEAAAVQARSQAREAPVRPEPIEAAPPPIPAQGLFIDSQQAPQAGRSTRELIEQARAAARAAAQEREGKGKKAKAAEGGTSLFGAAAFGSKRRGGTTLRTALLASGTLAALGVAASGYMMSVELKHPGHAPAKAAPDAPGALAAVASGPTAGDTARAAILLTTPTTAAEPLASAPATPSAHTVPAAAVTAAAPAPTSGPGADELYNDAVRRITAKQPGGLETLKKAANLGSPAAQFYLAKLFESGEAGLRKDPVEGRRWTERAAQAGDRRAMHNLALYYVEGTGGPKNTSQAVQWFRRAADLGLIDSQYNLGRLYEEGLGVGQNAAEAYKWYLIAGREGDGESRASAERVKAQLSPEAQSAAQRAAQAYRAAGAAPTQAAAAAASASKVNLSIAQRALSVLGYYQGPTDGGASPAVKLAIQAYQRDQSLAQTGALDQTTFDRLSAYAR